MDSVIGIDLTGLSRSTKGRTVAAHVAVEDPLRLLELHAIRPGKRGDRDLVDWIVERRPAVVGIDAPLTMPHSVLCNLDRCPRCEPGVAEYLSRHVDRLAGGMPTVMLAAIAFRGMWLARTLRGLGPEVIEVYPAASYRAMGAIGKTYEERAKLLQRRVAGLTSTDRDAIDATCSALVAVDWLRRTGGSLLATDGEIWLASGRDC